MIIAKINQKIEKKVLTFMVSWYTIHDVAGDEPGNVRLAKLDRAFGYGPKGREFESSNAR